MESDYRFHEWRILTGSDDNVEKDMVTLVEGGRDVQSFAAILKNLHHNEQGMMSAAMQQPVLISMKDLRTMLTLSPMGTATVMSGWLRQPN